MHLTRRELLLGAASFPVLAANKAASRPGIVMVVVEDLGAWMLGCYGNAEIRTPAMDLLARSGTRFNTAYAAAGTAVPGRAALLAGRAPRQIGQNIDSVPLISDVLSRAGYQCGFVGAWGSASQAKHGCETWDVTENPEEITAKALAFLEARKPGTPYLLIVSHTLRATPPANYLNSYASTRFNSVGWEPAAANAAANQDALRDIVGSLRKAAAAISAVDDQVAALVRKLDERKLRDDTLLLVTGSNGAMAGRHGLWGDSRATDPPNFFEEVVRVPLIWQLHGRTPPEAVQPELVSACDVLPTLCELANVPVPAGAKLPGRSYLPAVVNKPFPKKQPWKSLVFAESGDAVMARDKRYKLVLRGAGPGELYDEIADRHEKVNQFANPQFVTIREDLTADIEGWKKKL